MTKKVFLLLLFFGLISPLKAKDIYVSQNQTGSGNGSSCSSAHNTAWFNNKANWGSGSTQISPGTTVHLCGVITGTAGANVLTFFGGGSSSAATKLLFESGAALEAPYFGINAQAAINTNGYDWLVIDGGASHGSIRATANGSQLQYHANSLAINASRCSNCEFRNLAIENMYVHSVTSDHFNMYNDGCIYFSGSQSNVKIHDNVMHDAHWCISYTFGPGDRDIQIYNNQIYNVDHGIAIAGTNSNSVSEIQIYSNHIYSYANWDTGSTNAYHHDGIHVYGSGSSTVSNLTIRNNLFEGPVGGNVTSHIFVQSTARASRVLVFNNVFKADKPVNNGMVDLASGDNDAIYNNTFMGSTPTTGGGCYVTNSGISGQSFLNNVMSGCFNLITVQNITYTSGSPNNNVYANSGLYSAFKCGNNFYSLASFSQWKSCVRGDASSAAASDPKLSTQGQPLSGSVAIRKGVNLTSLCTGDLEPLCVDKYGARRAPSGAWDAGAITSVQSGGLLSPPTGLSATVN